MTPLRKFHIAITVLTVAVMSLILSKLIPWLEAKQAASTWLTVFIGIGGSSAIYTSVAKLLASLLEHYRPLKKFFLGKDDLQGTWIGTYLTSGGRRVFSVEHFEQDLENIRINGKGFSESGDVVGEWNSVASAIDTNRKKLIYAYSCDRFTKAEQFQGVCVFTLERPTSTKRPMVIHGYSADLTEEARKTENREYRIDDDFQDMMEAFSIAVDRFGNPSSEQGGDDQPTAAVDSKAE